jgi:energy-coupling factor transporter ATP-binding protein EcfA2
MRIKLTLLKTIASQVIRSTSSDFNHYHVQKIVILSGPGGSGKSAFCEIIQSLFPSTSSSPCSLSSRFENSRFVGTSAIFFSELPNFRHSGWSQVLSTFKQLSGKDLIRYEFKYGKLSSFRFYGTVFVTSNSPFKNDPRDEFISIDRRLMPFYFMDVIKPSKVDSGFAQKIVDKESTALKLIGFLCKDYLEEITRNLNDFYLPLVLLDNGEPSVKTQVDPLLAFAYHELETCRRKVEQPLLAKDLVTGFLHYLSMSFSDDPQIYDLRGYHEAIRLSLESTLG